MQARLRKAALDAGVTLIAPETVYLAADTKFGSDVTIEPFVVIGPGVTIADGAVIHSFSHIVQATIGKKASVGPYARLRPGTSLGDGAKIGNFVETKAATLEAGVKVNHLSYIGDAHVGANANIGAGTITCNYDGFSKHKTDDRRGRLRRHQFLAGGAGENRQRRLYRLGLGHHQGRARRRDGGRAQPADQPRGRRQAISRDEDKGKPPKERLSEWLLSFPLKTVSIRNKFRHIQQNQKLPNRRKLWFPNSFSCLVSKIGKNSPSVHATTCRVLRFLAAFFSMPHPTSRPRFRSSWLALPDRNRTSPSSAICARARP